MPLRKPSLPHTRPSSQSGGSGIRTASPPPPSTPTSHEVAASSAATPSSDVSSDALRRLRSRHMATRSRPISPLPSRDGVISARSHAMNAANVPLPRLARDASSVAATATTLAAGSRLSALCSSSPWLPSAVSAACSSPSVFAAHAASAAHAFTAALEPPPPESNPRSHARSAGSLLLCTSSVEGPRRCPVSARRPLSSAATAAATLSSRSTVGPSSAYVHG